MKKLLYVLSWVFAVLLAILFLLAGAGKLGGGATEMFAKWGYPSWFAIFIGVAEVAGAIGLLIPRLTRLAIIGLTILMIGAAYTHVAAGEGLDVLRPIIFGIFLWLVWFFRGSSTSAESEVEEPE
ncbi:MAG: DoxX family protein [Acidobacteriota bacterium]|nr:DoxX family protein [Acidobacteriota bacterium]MDH3529788.1 DoxX family protein [Acidobacteriota bacterium]